MCVWVRFLLLSSLARLFLDRGRGVWGHGASHGPCELSGFSKALHSGWVMRSVSCSKLSNECNVCYFSNKQQTHGRGMQTE